MSPFKKALTACMWIKRVDTSGSYPVVFHYRTSSEPYEILIAAEGEYNRVVGDTVLENSHNHFQTDPVGQWFSYCLCWSRATNTIQLYLDGKLVRSGKTFSGNWRELHTFGTLWFNRLGSSESSDYIFGGQLFQFNMFPEVLSAESIRKIAQGGLCFDMSEISSVPELKWEEVIAQSRSGNVTEVIGCDISETPAYMKKEIKRLSGEVSSLTGELRNVTRELNSTKTNLNSVSTQLTETQHELKAVRKTLNKTEVNLETCNSTLLEKTDQLKLTVGKLENCSSSLKEAMKDLQEARKLEDVTKWDVLYTSPYFNRFLTSELIEQLKSSWGVLENFVGVNMTETIVEHFRQHDVENQNCTDLDINNVYEMLGDLIGDEMLMTDGILHHFIENHNEEPCEG